MTSEPLAFCWESAAGTAGGAAETKHHTRIINFGMLIYKFRLKKAWKLKCLNESSPAVIGGRGGRDEDEQLTLLDVRPIALLRKQPRVNMC